MAENYPALLSGFVLLSVSLGMGGMEALNGKLLSSAAWNFLAWAGYLVMHYGETGDYDGYVEEYEGNPIITLTGIIILISGISIGSFYAIQNSYTGAVLGTTFYVIGFSITHYGLEKRLL